MKIFWLLTLLIPQLVWAQATHREATAEERAHLLDANQEEKLKILGKSLAQEHENSTIEKALLQEAFDQGKLPPQKIQGYIQHLTNQEVDQKIIEKKLDSLSRKYFAHQQLKQMDQVLPQNKQAEFQKRFNDLNEKRSSFKELDQLLSELDQEISSSEITRKNEKDFAAFRESLFKEFKARKFTKSSELPVGEYSPMKVMVPHDFSLKNSQEEIPLCLVQEVPSATEQMTKLSQKIQELSSEPKVKEIWIAWGYNRSKHTKSDVKFETPHGTFTIHDAQGKDKPTPFSLDYFHPEKLSIPQYNIEIGVMFNEKWGMDLRMDHMKYVFDRLQPYEITGDLDLIVAGANGRIDFEKAKELKDASWLRFEHTDGYNYLATGAIYNQKILQTKKDRFAIDARFGAGAGLMIPRTDVRLYHSKEGHRYGINNKFHIAGGGVHADARLKFTFWDSVFLQATTRGTYIKVENALVDGADARMEHIQPIGSVQIIGQIGYQYKFKAKDKKKANSDNK